MKIKIIFLFLIISISNSFNLFCQSIATDKTDVRVIPSSIYNQSEAHISINKFSPNNILVSFNTNQVNPLNSSINQQGFGFSTDGGFTWNYSDDKPPYGENEQGISYCDPSTAFDASGNGYFITLSPFLNPGNNNHFPRGYYVQKTTNNGLSWTNSLVGIGPIACYDGGIDKEMAVTVDEMQTSPYVNYFYCAWTDDCDYNIKINRSTDGGNSFSQSPVILNNLMYGFPIGANVQTGPNGEINVCWASININTSKCTSIGFSNSTDGGLTFNSTTAFQINGLDFNIHSYFHDCKVVGMPSMAIDKSCGSHRGRIYIAYPEFENTNSTRTVIRIRHSDNNGSSWSSASTINITTGLQNFFPWVAVDDLTGLVNVVYYSFDDPTKDFWTNTYVAYSTDGGSNWNNIKVSDYGHYTERINPDYVYIGDYIGISTFGAKSIVAWADHRGTEPWQIYTSVVNYDLDQLSSSQTDLFINQPSNLLENKIYQAFNKVECANINSVTVGSTINQNNKIEFIAGNEIILNSGFSTQGEIDFTARINNNISPCTTPGAINSLFKLNDWISSENIIKKEIEGQVKAFVYPSPAKDLVTIGCLNNNYKNVLISISDLKGKLVFKNILPEINSDQIRKIIDINNLSSGEYIVDINIDGKTHNINFIKE